MKKSLMLLMLFLTFWMSAGEKVKLGFFVREGETDLTAMKKVPTNLMVTFDETVIFDSLLPDWIQKETEKDGKAPKVTVDGLQAEFLKALDKAVKSGKPLKRITAKDQADRKYLMVVNVDRIIPVPLAGHTISCKISIYDTAVADKPLSVLTLQIMESGGTVPGMVSDKGIGQAGLQIGNMLKLLVNNPKAARSEE